MRNIEAFSSPGLCKFMLLNVQAKIAHEIGTHLKHSGFSRIKAEVNKHIASGSDNFLFHDRPGQQLAISIQLLGPILAWVLSFYWELRAGSFIG